MSGLRKQKKILILDDIFGHYFFKEIEKRNNNVSFYVRGNVLDPMKYFKYIVKTKPDIVILKIWYKNGEYLLPKGINLLERLLAVLGAEKIEEKKSFFGLIKRQNNKGMVLDLPNTKFVIVDEYGNKNMNIYPVLKKINNLYFIKDNNIDDVNQLL